MLIGTLPLYGRSRSPQSNPDILSDGVGGRLQAVCRRKGIYCELSLMLANVPSKPSGPQPPVSGLSGGDAETPCSFLLNKAAIDQSG